MSDAAGDAASGAAAGNASRRHRGGFTLLELCIVAAVVVVLAAAAMPALTMLLGRQDGMTAQGQLRAFAAAQRHEAIVSGNVRWLRFEAGGHHLIAGVDGQPADDEAALADAVELLSDVAERLDDDRFDLLLADGADASLADAGWSSPTLFYPDGTATPATMAFRLRGRDLVVRVDQWSGAVR